MASSCCAAATLRVSGKRVCALHLLWPQDSRPPVELSVVRARAQAMLLRGCLSLSIFCCLRARISVGERILFV
jgi:hypothetical protein